MIKPKVLFLCTANSCRTQMAEAFLRDLAGERFEVASAGGEVDGIDPDAIKVMREVGIDISLQQAKDVKQFFGQRFTFIVTLCDRKTERSCPIFPGSIWNLQWPLENAANASEEHIVVVRRLRDEIRRRVSDFVAEHA